MCGSGSLVAVFQSANAKVYIDGDASAFMGRVFVGQDGTYAKSTGAGFFNLTANGTWFVIYNRTPHDVALAALEDNLKMLKERNWGWALQERAAVALTNVAQTVTAKTMVPPSGDKHDYMSFGPYWWPDPSKPDGLPYIRRDGETNPQTLADRLAALRLPVVGTAR